jgi:hypothetical protein
LHLGGIRVNWRVIAACAIPFVVLGPVPSAAGADHGPVFSFRDPRISESSGLVDLGSMMVTTNDSGDRSRLFVVEGASGRTVGVTDFRARTSDVEALAPAGRTSVWVGDIGDNRASRSFVRVIRVSLGIGHRKVRAPAYRLVYPKHRGHDAESLFSDRRGRLYVVTKTFFGGTVYRAPLRLHRDRANRLQPVGRVREFATDAALTPDGRHLLVRGYDSAGVYAFPSLRRVGDFMLPAQRQGEGISVGPGNRVRLSSEGVHSLVRQVLLPPALARIVSPPPRAPSPPASPSPSPSVSASPLPSSTVAPSPSPSGDPSPASARTAVHPVASSGLFQRRWLLWSIPGVIALGAIGIGLGLRRRSD